MGVFGGIIPGNQGIPARTLTASAGGRGQFSSNKTRGDLGKLGGCQTEGRKTTINEQSVNNVSNVRLHFLCMVAF